MRAHRRLRWRLVVIWTVKVKISIHRRSELGQPRQRGWPAPWGISVPSVIRWKYDSMSHKISVRGLGQSGCERPMHSRLVGDVAR